MGFEQGAPTREIIGSDLDKDVFGNSVPFTGGRSNQAWPRTLSAGLGPRVAIRL